MSSMDILQNLTQNAVLKLATEDTVNVAHTQSPTKKVTAKALGTDPTPTSTGVPAHAPTLPLGAAMTKDQVAQMDANNAMRGAAYQQGLSAGQSDTTSSGIPTWVWVAGAAAVLYYMSSR